VRVTKLVPAVARAERGGVRALDQLAAADGLEHEQVAGVGLVPAGEQPVDRAHAALRGHDQARPAPAGRDLAARGGDGLQRAHDGRADRDHAAAGGAMRVDAAGGDLRSWLEQLGRKVTRLLAMADDLINRTTFLDDVKAVQPIPMSRLRTLTCPVRAIYGEHSDVVDYARELDAYLPHCELTVLAGCGHSVLMDATAALREIVLDWLAIQASVITP